MTGVDLAYLAPLVILGLTALSIMLAISFTRNHLLTLGMAVIGFFGAFIAAVWHIGSPARDIGILLRIDAFASFYTAALCLVGLMVAILAHDYFRDRLHMPEEFYILLVVATTGCITLVSALNFASVFLGLEILSVSLYAMISYTVARERSIEAGVKYLVLAAVSSAFLVFGIALIYSETGSLSITALAAPVGSEHSLIRVVGLGMLLVGAGYKLAVVPFHLWTPDVYEGAPAPATAFVATASKGAMVALLLRLFYELQLPVRGGLYVALAVIAIASMLIGNLLALLQSNVKRILAYSSIAHLGYVLVAFLTTAQMAGASATYYVLAYMATTLGAFGVVSVLSEPDNEAEDLVDYQGLAWKRPALCAVMSAMLLSLAGIPLTAGFIGKFYVVAAGAQVSLWLILGVLVVSSTIGLFYYLRILIAMYSGPPEVSAYETPPLESVLPRLATVAAGATLACLLLIVLWLGVYPGPVFALMQALMFPM